MVKKLVGVFLFLLLSTSLFASGHGLNGLQYVFDFFVGAFIYLLALIGLTILAAINRSKPEKNRSRVYTVILSIFTVIFLFVFITMIVMFYSNGRGGTGVLTSLSLIFILPIVLNAVFLAEAFEKLKKNKNSPGKN